MEIDHEQWANADEWLTTAQLASLTRTTRAFWNQARAKGDGPPWTSFRNRPSYRRSDVEAWIIATSIREPSRWVRS